VIGGSALVAMMFRPLWRRNPDRGRLDDYEFIKRDGFPAYRRCYPIVTQALFWPADSAANLIRHPIGHGVLPSILGASCMS